MGDSFDTTGLIIALGIPAYVLLQLVALSRLASGWRKAAFAPLVFAIPIAFWCLAAFAAQSNLWPVPFILFAPVGAFYLAVLLVVRSALRSIG